MAANPPPVDLISGYFDALKLPAHGSALRAGPLAPREPHAAPAIANFRDAVMRVLRDGRGDAVDPSGLISAAGGSLDQALGVVSELISFGLVERVEKGFVLTPTGAKAADAIT